MNQPPKKYPDHHALVILSGGQDSVTCLLFAKRDFGRVSAISFDYGQRHARELECAKMIALLEDVPHEIIPLGPILKGTSPLTNQAESLEQYNSFQEMEDIIGKRVEKTFVPMRNALFLTIAANRAAVMGANEIVIGVCEQDGANYPDCRSKFITSQECAINDALGRLRMSEDAIWVSTPLLKETKASAIIKLAAMGGSDVMLAFTHTAYDGQYPPIGKDHATVLRAQGFLEANRPDPLILKAFSEGLMSLPNTINYQDHELNADLIKRIQAIQRIYDSLAPHDQAAAVEAVNSEDYGDAGA